MPKTVYAGDYDRLVGVNKEVRKSFLSACRIDWSTSDFAWITRLPPKGRHSAAVRLLQASLLTLGLEFGCRYPDGDCVLDSTGSKRGLVRVKFSTLWSTGVYRFQQLYRDEKAGHVLLFGLCPDQVDFWILPQRVILRKWGGDVVKEQHGNRTAWMTLRPGGEGSPKWLERYRKGLDAIVRALGSVETQR